MRISKFCVHRPVFTSMVTMIVVLLGMVSLARLPIDLMPDITFPTLSVSASYSNASPEEMENLVARPIEEAMVAIPGVEEVSTVCSEGSANIRIAFAWGTDLNEAANDIRERLDRVLPRLPEDADRPRLRKFDLAAFPILILGASGELDPVQMRQLVEDQVKYRIERVPGVASLDIWGGREREIHIDLLPERIRALGLSLPGVLRAVRDSNVNLPAGYIERGHYEVTVRTPGEFTSLDELRGTVVAMRDGSPVRLGQVAAVRDAWQRGGRSIRIDGEPGIRLSVNKQSGRNTVEVANGVLAEIERLNRDLPQLRVTPIIDTSDYIRRSISNVSNAALLGGGLAVLVLLFFLRDVRSTAVVAISIPVSIVATFALMYFGGMTLNIMSLGGLALGVGMLVDNAIVVLENIFRHREEGLGDHESARAGSEEVTPAIVASTLTTMAVFLPMVFIRGMAGVMFSELAWVVAFALLCSLGAAITIVPMLSARLLRAQAGPGERETLGQRAFRATGVCFRFIEDEYKAALNLALRRRWAVVLVTVAALGGSLALVPLVGSELMPASDEGEVRVNLEMDVGMRSDLLDEKMLEVEEIVRASVPEIRTMIATSGGGHWRGGGGHTGQLRISLAPLGERQRSSDEVAHALRGALTGIPGVVVRSRPGQGLFIFRRMAGAAGDSVDIEIRGHDLDMSQALARRIEAMAAQVEGVTDIEISREVGAPEEVVLVDRDKAADMRLTVAEIAGMLQTVLGGSRAGAFREGGKEYTILARVDNAERMELRELLDLTLTNGLGEAVSLRNVTRVQTRSGPTRIERRNQERVTTVSVNYHGRTLSEMVEDMRAGLRRVPVPAGFSIAFTGDYEEQQEAFAELLVTLALALALVYMVMACQFESLRDPFVVMFSVPLAIIGVILMLFLTGTTFNIQSYIGCIMLGGIVVNNAILLVDHTNLLRRRDGLALREAIEEAGRRRLRPILMTAMTTILGLTPLALGIGEGSEAQAPMARAVIGGLISSTLITLVFVPVVYSLFERNGGE